MSAFSICLKPAKLAIKNFFLGMKAKNYICIIILMLSFVNYLQAQLPETVVENSPEQEAAKQTAKLEQELNLTLEQTKKIYEINLRYAKQRQLCNKRSEVMELIKKKDVEIQQVLSGDQYQQLLNKRNERSTMQVPTTEGIRNITPSYRPINERKSIESNSSNRMKQKNTSSKPSPRK